MNYGGRVPSEPSASSDGDADDGVRLLNLDFATLPGEKGSDEYRAAIKAFVDRVSEQCVELTTMTTTDDDGGGPAWSPEGKKDGISYWHLRVAGSPFPLCRHTAEFGGPASTVLALFNSLYCTNLIDPFAFHAEVKEECEPGPEYKWCHVAWTVDSFNPLFAVRDFVTLDFGDPGRSMICSRSVKHPLVPETEPPGLFSFLFKGLKSRTYRVPLLYVLRVLPIDEDRCVVHQLQWSDVGGVLPDKHVVEGVERFGYDSMARMMKVTEMAKAKNVAPPMEDPLRPGWTSHPSVKIPELFS